MKVWIQRLAVLTIAAMTAMSLTVYYFSADILENYRPKIEALLSSSLGIKAGYREIRIVLPLSEVIISEIELKSLPDSTTEFQAAIPSAIFQIHPLALLEHRLDILKVVIDSPQLRIQKVVSDSSAVLKQKVSEPAADKVQAESISLKLPEEIKGGLKVHSIEMHNGSFISALSDGTSSLNDLALSEFNFFSNLSWSDQQLLFSKTSSSFVIKFRDGTTSALSFNLPNLAYTQLNGQISIDPSQLILDKQKFVISGDSNSAFSNLSSKLAAKETDLSILSKFISKFVPEFRTVLAGKLTAELEFKLNAGNRKLSGNLKLQKFTAAGKDFNLDSAALSKIDFSTDKSGLVSLSGSTEVSGVRIKDGDCEYKTTSIAGPISLKQPASGTSNISSELSVIGFAFKDKDTTIEDVNAGLSQLRCTISKAGDVEVALNLRGDSIMLQTDGVQIRKADSIQSPLTISIPAQGGYRVSGPVQVKNSEMTLSGHDLKNVSGLIDILVSGPVKRFVASSLSAAQDKENLEAVAEFEMTKPAYNLKSLNAKIAGGNITGQFSMDRGAGNQLATTLEAQNLDLGQLLTIIDPGKISSADGTIQKLNLSLACKKGQIPASLSGNGSIQLSNSIVDKISIDGKLKDSLGSIPVIGSFFKFEPVQKAEPTQNRDSAAEKYAMKQLAARSLTASFKFENQGITSKDLIINGRHGIINISGNYTFDDNLNLAGNAIFLEQTARSLAGPIKPLAGLFGSLGKIEIPFKVSGKSSDPFVGLDASRLHNVTAPGRLVGSTANAVGGIVSGVGNLFRSGKSSSSEQTQP